MKSSRSTWQRFLQAALLGLVAPSVPAAAQEGSSTPLEMREVFDAVALRHPESEIARRDVDKAEGRKFGVRGVWDPQLKLTNYVVPLGYYRYTSFESMIRQETPLWGLGIYAGYRATWGKLPIYRLDRETQSGGEFRLGADLPLWKDRKIDERRANVSKGDYLAQESRCRQDSTRLRLALAAATTYWDWVESGQDVRIQKEVLEWANDRDAGLREQAVVGQIADIVVVDNQRLVLERRSKLVKAEQSWQEASIKLSLFLRDQNAQPVLVAEERLPALDAVVTRDLSFDLDRDLELAIKQRPELCELERNLAAANVDLALARNQVAPQVNLQSYVAKDIGSGPANLAPVEAGAAVVVSMPLALRSARGKAREADAARQGLVAKYQMQADKIRTEVRLAAVKLRAAQQQAELAKEQQRVARDLVAAEREKFSQGVSTLVVVNLRELAAAQAATDAVEAIANVERAKLAYHIALGETF
jgi:outer membrane protein TolC